MWTKNVKIVGETGNFNMETAWQRAGR